MIEKLDLNVLNDSGFNSKELLLASKLNEIIDFLNVQFSLPPEEHQDNE